MPQNKAKLPNEMADMNVKIHKKRKPTMLFLDKSRIR